MPNPCSEKEAEDNLTINSISNRAKALKESLSKNC